ncbi:Tho complex subunit 7-domain-containing protein [Calycina marina]|uniref:Tho complex subunit 7-domain-containing protein n=1 Tax=Calycina marina TaxID=1763456 RepID=A0A9P8CDM0_9HELO|nr:Tho complex subunit 7-domain-containing protein [Calycina marina]
MASFSMLEQREEDELHKLRLLNVEEKPFKRVAKRLLAPGSLVSTPTSKLLTLPPEETIDDEALEAEMHKIAENRRQFREDVLLDFAAFESSIARIQFLRNSNEQERERYKADKERILNTAQAVRDSTAQLRIQLEEAKATLAQRKKFDVLAEKITSNKALKPRDEQVLALRKLEEECVDLKRESELYSETWAERRAQFGRIVEEGQQLRRLIRDEKEEVERREGMDVDAQEDGEIGEGSIGYGTPRQNGNQDNESLRPRHMLAGALSRPGSRSNSRAPSPAPSERRSQEDVTMADEAPKYDTPKNDTPKVDNSHNDNPKTETEAPKDEHMADNAGAEVRLEAPQVTVDEPADEGQAPANAGAEDKMEVDT